MPSGKRSLRERKSPPKRRGANRRKAKTDPISQLYAELQQDWPRARSKRPRKVSAKQRKRSGGAVKKRGKKVAVAKARSQRRA